MPTESLDPGGDDEPEVGHQGQELDRRPVAAQHHGRRGIDVPVAHRTIALDARDRVVVEERYAGRQQFAGAEGPDERAIRGAEHADHAVETHGGHQPLIR